jgi:hypothetical protein
MKMITRKITIVIRGESEGDVEDAFDEAVTRLKGGFTSGSDRNDASGFYFSNTGDVPADEIPYQPRLAPTGNKAAPDPQERTTAGPQNKRHQYVASGGWGHIFVGTREETTRWIYDRATQSLVAAQVLQGNSWIDLEAAALPDLLESIHDNDAINGLEAFGLTEWAHLPTWQEIVERASGDQENIPTDSPRG